MKFKIKKIRKIIKTNIQGKVIDENVWYVVYRSFLFGLIKWYIKISPQKGWKVSYEVTVMYRPWYQASKFADYEAAEELIQDIKKNPSHFVRFKQ